MARCLAQADVARNDRREHLAREVLFDLLDHLNGQVGAAIKKLGPFENLLIVTGENPAKAGVPYIAKALDLAKPYFSNLKIEVMPLKTEEYAELVHHGLDGGIWFQESYHKARHNV